MSIETFSFEEKGKYFINHKKELSILGYSWNTKSIRLSNLSSLFSEGVKIDFFDPIKEKIIDKSPDLFVFCTQEDTSPSSHFHSHFLIQEMDKLDYILVKRAKYMGIGKTTYDGVKECNIKFRGLRTSIYCKKILSEHITEDALNKDINFRVGNNGQKFYNSDILCSKGAIISYISFFGFRVIAIINCHLPHNSKSLINLKNTNNYILRQNVLNYSNIEFNNIINYALSEKITKNVLLFGDLNYRIMDHEHDIDDFEQCYKYDELKTQMNKENIFYMKEGVDNQGPRFHPTSKMKIGRKEKEYKIGKFEQRNPSWCDRILYNNYSKDNETICLEYDSLFTGESMKLSDHDMVYGLYNIISK